MLKIVRKLKKICTNKIIDALKYEISNNDISKHIEIIDYMHKTEISNLHSRNESQIMLKDQQIRTLEEKISELKSIIKELKSQIADKSNEFDYYSKEEAIRNKELEFKVKLEADKLVNSIINEREEIESRLKKELEKEREKYFHDTNQLEKKIRRISQKLIDLNTLRERDKKEFAKKIKQPCVKCARLGLVEEQLSDTLNEKQDLLNKISIFENKVKELEFNNTKQFIKLPKYIENEKSIQTEECEQDDLEELQSIPLTSRVNQKELLNINSKVSKINLDKLLKAKMYKYKDNSDTNKESKVSSRKKIKRMTERSNIKEEARPTLNSLCNHKRQYLQIKKISPRTEKLNTLSNDDKIKEWSDNEQIYSPLASNNLLNTRNDTAKKF